MNTEAGKAFGWDDEVAEVENEFVVFPEGDYDFKVVDFERAYFDGSKKMPPCNMAKLKYEVTGKDGKTGTVNQNLFLHSKTQWQMTNFACAIGHAKRGDGTFTIRWNEVIGATGRFHLVIHKYKTRNGDDLESNNIQKFYDKEETTTKAYTKGAF